MRSNPVLCFRLQKDVALAVLALVVLMPFARAADVRITPSADVRVETNTNRNLAQADEAKLDSTGYIGEFDLLMTRLTPRSDLTLRPRLRLQEYGETSDLERLEGRLDGRWLYSWERSEFQLTGEASHEDYINSELPAAGFNEINPDEPTAPASGLVSEGGTRNLVSIAPKWSHQISDRWGAGIEALYEAARFDSEGTTSNVDYDYWWTQVSASWRAGPRTDVEFGPYVNSYEATDGSSQIDGYGIEASVLQRWTELYQTELSIFYEHSDLEYVDPTPTSESESGFGGTVALVRKTDVSQTRLIAGRIYTPSSQGSMRTSDQFRIQYDRDLSERLSFKAACRYNSDNSIGSRGTGSDRDYLAAEVSARYQLTQSWNMGGGYKYRWQEYHDAPDDADNQSFFIGVGYAPPRARR